MPGSVRRFARSREERLPGQRFRDERQAAQLAQRFEAEKYAAVAEVSQVHRPDWWDRADAARIGQTYATACAWAPEAPEAAAAGQRMREELQARYGIDLARLDPRSVSAEVEAWRQRLEDQRRQEADRQRTAETAERAEAAVLLDQAGREDRTGDAARNDGRQAEAQAEGLGENPWLSPGQDSDKADERRGKAAEDRQTAQDGEAPSNHTAGEAERVLRQRRAPRR